MSILYQWPAASEFGRVVPKSKFYEHANVTASVRKKFVADVRRITWAYKLADETVHLQGSDAVPEIQIFVLEIKGENVHDDVLAAIDKAVTSPIIFELERVHADPPQVRMTACHKQVQAKPLLSGYFSTGWLPANAERLPLPTALDLTSLYGNLLASVLPVAVRKGELIADAAGRVGQARKLEREVQGLERRLRSEPQLNRKIELRRELLNRTEVLTALRSPVGATADSKPPKDN